MSDENFNQKALLKIIDLHDEHLSSIPKSSLELYESQEAVMWDGYIKPIVELNNAIDLAFRYNVNIKATDISETFKAGGIERLSLAEIGFVFRDILVHEKTNLGLFSRVIMDGRVSRLVKRLKLVIN